MYDNTCLQCKKITKGTTNRLVQDSCGHKKCRLCLLEDETGCKQCEGASQVDVSKCNGAESSVIKYENHATVITCNGLELDKSAGPAPKGDVRANEVVPKPKPSGSKKKVKNKGKRAYNVIDIPKYISVELDTHLFHCNICNKSFATKNHVKYHTYCAGVKSYSCSICHKEFVLKTQLDIHLYKHAEQKPYKCTICGRTFAEKSKLKRHGVLHSSLKSYICSVCGKAFKTKESLKVHSIIHREEKPFACKFCKTKFNNSSNLKKHLTSHSNNKEHMCDQCGKRFKLKWALSVHQKSHLRIREHICFVCNKAFVNSKDLQRHKLIHLETKDYTCSICKTGFRRKDNLSRHIRNTHPGKNAEIIKTVLKPTPPSAKPVDNPNAINVITASPAFNKTKPDANVRTGTVINGPPKLAFKTPAFKNNYNIQRDHRVPTPNHTTYNMTDSVNICQKILSPHTTVTNQKVNEPAISTGICQKILEPNSTPLHYETSFQNRKHAMIKNIKFKVPIQYTMNAKRELYKDIVPLEPLKSVACEPLRSHDSTYTELQTLSTAPTSVIVNTPSASMHWRRRTSQTLNFK